MSIIEDRPVAEPEHQPRERAVPCARCGAQTWEHGAVCQRCQAQERVRLTPERQAQWAAMADRADPEGCWVWRGAADAQGYGSFRVEGHQERVHRISYRMHHGPIPSGQQIDHICRVRLCVNPAHLRLATIRQNSANSGPRAGTSTFKGVSWKADVQGWAAYIHVDRRSRLVGTFPDEVTAARAYDAAALESFGEFAYLNFPSDVAS